MMVVVCITVFSRIEIILFISFYHLDSSVIFRVYSLCLCVYSCIPHQTRFFHFADYICLIRTIDLCEKQTKTKLIYLHNTLVRWNDNKYCIERAKGARMGKRKSKRAYEHDNSKRVTSRRRIVNCLKTKKSNKKNQQTHAHTYGSSKRNRVKVSTYAVAEYVGLGCHDYIERALSHIAFNIQTMAKIVGVWHLKRIFTSSHSTITECSLVCATI